jgi:hypothetical protein
MRPTLKRFTSFFSSHALKAAPSFTPHLQRHPQLASWRRDANSPARIDRSLLVPWRTRDVEEWVEVVHVHDDAVAGARHAKHAAKARWQSHTVSALPSRPSAQSKSHRMQRLLMSTV